MYIICQNNQHLSYFCVILFICKVRADGIIQNLLLLPGSRKPLSFLLSCNHSRFWLSCLDPLSFLLPGNNSRFWIIPSALTRKLKGSKQDSQNLLCLPESRKHKDSINRTAKICCGYLGAGNSKGLNRQPKSTVVTWEKETQRMVKR
jgi:hypothetical protein